ncbi:hypothetical protein HDU81_011195 [Chytriomyces hyalinus]|nr:hypothetical protein HDU81_011195 [Chytriomyces hyalinus]
MSNANESWIPSEQAVHVHNASSPSVPREFDAGIPIRYRTMSLKYDEMAKTKNRMKFKHSKNAADAIRDIHVHLLRVDDVFVKYGTSPSVGLEDAMVARRRGAKDGKNRISAPKTHYVQKALNYVFGGFNFLMWIACIVTVLSYYPLGLPKPNPFNLGVACLIFFVIIVSSVFYALVDWNASRIMRSIRSLVSETATVLRNGQSVTIPSTDIVVGDVVLLSLGDRVPADIRLTACSNDLKLDRSLLTGESDPVSGTVEATEENPLETRNLAFSSTFVVQGTAVGVVFAVGDDTLMGIIIKLSGEQKFKLTTIQKELQFFTIIISSLALLFFTLSMIVYATWIRQDHASYETLSVAIVNALGCLTAFVPQGLPVCVALSLTIVARRMARGKVLVKNLAVIETLGCMSVLCTDKTGTLTEGKMTVDKVAFLDKTFDASSADSINSSVAFKTLHRISHLCNGAKFDADSTEKRVSEKSAKGDSTDVAILKFAEFLGAGEVVRGEYERVFEVAFNSRNKWMLSIVKPRGGSITESELLIKGAPDVLFSQCTSVLRSDGFIAAFDEEAQRHILSTHQTWASQGMRVIAVCQRSLQNMRWESTRDTNIQAEIKNLTLVGLMAIRDPPRPDVPAAIETIRRAGVRVFMVTGDFMATAEAIARQVGIVGCEHVDRYEDLQQHVREAVEGGIGAVFQNAHPSEIKPDESELRALVLTGSDIDRFEKREWDLVFGLYQEIVFARTTPKQKLTIVEQAQLRGDNTVAVTGDGVNDAPALKAADIGVAMGAGSDVAKEAAAMVLLNNDFASICTGIENGRLVFDNLKKVILYVMPAGTYTEFVAVLMNVFFGMQVPLNSYLQVFFSIFHDVSMSMGLMFEQPESDLMLRKPRNARTDRLTDWRFFLQVYGFIGLVMWTCSLGSAFLFMRNNGIGLSSLVFVFENWSFSGDSLAYVLQNSPEYAPGTDVQSIDVSTLSGQASLTNLVSSMNSVYYLCMIFMQFGGLFAARNRRMSILDSNPLWGPRANWMLFVGMGVSLSCGFLNVYTPGIQGLFGTGLVPVEFWVLPVGFGVAVLVLDEVRKLVVRTWPESVVGYCAW